MFPLLVAACLVTAGAVYLYDRQGDTERAMASGVTVSPDDSAPASGEEKHSAPSASTNSVAQATLPVVASPVPQAAPSGSAPESPRGDPQPSDTISPNPPNGLVFSGTGPFQVYRQGNLTWRVNTRSGKTCILFATDEEWRKTRVYEHGCARS